MSKTSTITKLSSMTSTSKSYNVPSKSVQIKTTTKTPNKNTQIKPTSKETPVVVKTSTTIKYANGTTVTTSVSKNNSKK